MANNFDEEKNKLLKIISSQQKSLDWYKRTYEERSLVGIIYERILKKFATKFQKKVKINKTHSLFSGKILCVIVNHNYSGNAENLKKILLNYYDTIILDSGSDIPPENSLKFENIYYSALLNQAYNIAIEEGYKYLFFICSDVFITPQQAATIFTRLSNIDLDKIGLYSPASKGSSYVFCTKQATESLREVPFVEGYIFLCDITILNNICPIDTNMNLYGWGIDIAKAYYAREKNKLCVIDDTVEVDHMIGTGYSREIAKIEMNHWVKSFNNNSFLEFYNKTIKLVEA